MIRIPIPETIVILPLLIGLIAGVLLAVLVVVAREAWPTGPAPKHRGEGEERRAQAGEDPLAAAGHSPTLRPTSGRHARLCADDDPDSVWTMALPAYRMPAEREVSA